MAPFLQYILLAWIFKYTGYEKQFRYNLLMKLTLDVRETNIAVINIVLEQQETHMVITEMSDFPVNISKLSLHRLVREIFIEESELHFGSFTYKR
uniref:Uncharacterized protein n=1 Tax=Glossina palpalis gambiensis TaxID=67801 RepID=A0A1B0B2I1_9MUSC